MFPQFSVFQTAAWEYPHLSRINKLRCNKRIRAVMFTECEAWSATQFKDFKLLIITKRSIFYVRLEIIVQINVERQNKGYSETSVNVSFTVQNLYIYIFFNCLKNHRRKISICKPFKMLLLI